MMELLRYGKEITTFMHCHEQQRVTPSIPNAIVARVWSPTFFIGLFCVCQKLNIRMLLFVCNLILL